MLSFEELRKVDPALKDVSDDELWEIRDLLYQQAQLALQCFLESKGVENPSIAYDHTSPEPLPDHMKSIGKKSRSKRTGQF